MRDKKNAEVIIPSLIISDYTKTTQNILVVDDNEVTLGIMEAFLQKFYNVVAMSSGMSALTYLLSNDVDLILLDYMMPEMDGLEVFKHIREDYSERSTPIIFFTSVAEKEMVMCGLELHPDDYLLKPVSEEDLLLRVRKVLGGKKRSK